MSAKQNKPTGSAIKILTLFLLFCGTPAHAQELGDFRKFNLDSIVSAQRLTKKTWNGFLDTETLQAGIYWLAAEQKDDQTPHRYDEVYYVLNGKAKLHAGSKTISICPGTIAFVKAGVVHSFFEIDGDLFVLVIFSKASGSPAGIESAEHTIHNSLVKRDPNKNVWDEFLKVQSLSMGMFMLSPKTGSENAISHLSDELKIITSGSSRFSVKDKTYSVGSGDLLYLKKGTPHSFNHVSRDLDMLIFLENGTHR